jgi:hypothetical protein
MSFDAEQHVLYRIANAPLLRHPFPHCYVESAFPDEFYRELRARLPDLAAYKRLDETGTVAKGRYTARYVCDVAELAGDDSAGGRFWSGVHAWLGGEAFAWTVLKKFREGFAERFGPDIEPRFETEVRLVRDFTNYAITPHTDAPRKLVSLLFYLPADESMRHLGTSIYLPKDPAFRCEGTTHHTFEPFRKVATMGFRPNSLFAFFKTDRAFHGVDRIADEGVARDLLLYNVYVTKLVSTRPPPTARPGDARPRAEERA